MASEIDKLDALDTDVQQFVIFHTGRELFAIKIALIQEIIRMPDMVRMPLSPPSLVGLANLRGKILPVMSLRKRFGLDNKESDDSTRVVVVDLKGSLMGLVVDMISSVVSVEPEFIEDVNSNQTTIDSDLVTGVIKKSNQTDQMVMILDVETLVNDEFNEMQGALKSFDKTEARGAADSMHEAVETDDLQLVSFSVAGQEYALPIDQVQEIVQVPEDISIIPKSEDHILGIITLRNRLLPLVSLRKLFKLPYSELSEHNRIVVISLGENVSVGLVMDTVNEVLRVDKKIVDELPKLFNKNDDNAEIQSICRLDDGKRLVSVLSIDKMFSNAIIRKVMEAQSLEENAMEGTNIDENVKTSAKDDGESQIVVFWLDHEEYGVPIESVQEIVRVPEQLVHIPKSPNFIEGVINLRGTVLPVVDMRSRFGLDRMERTERQRIVVFLISGVRTGFIVDSVAEVLKILNSSISPAPKLSVEQAKLIRSVANLEKQKRMILLLENEQLLDIEQTYELAKMQADS